MGKMKAVECVRYGTYAEYICLTQRSNTVSQTRKHLLF